MKFFVVCNTEKTVDRPQVMRELRNPMRIHAAGETEIGSIERNAGEESGEQLDEEICKTTRLQL